MQCWSKSFRVACYKCISLLKLKSSMQQLFKSYISQKISLKIAVPYWRLEIASIKNSKDHDGKVFHFPLLVTNKNMKYTFCYFSVYSFLQLCYHVDILKTKVWKFQKGGSILFGILKVGSVKRGEDKIFKSGLKETIRGTRGDLSFQRGTFKREL